MSGEMRPCNVSLMIEYINSSKQTSQRVIDVKTYSTDANGIVRAYCHHRRTMRSFKYSNIQDCTDVLTGEMIVPTELLTYFNAVYDTDPARELDAFLYEHKPIIDVLTYMMQADGRITPSERKVILKWVFENSFLSEQFINYGDDILKTWVPPQDERQYLIVLQYVNKLFPEITTEIYEHAQAIMLADKKIHENEITALEQMKRVFGIELRETANDL